MACPCASTTPAVDHGLIRAFQNRNYDVAQGAADRHDAQRGLRPHLAAAGRRPRRSSWNSISSIAPIPKGRTNYNTIAEIPGTDKADEVVMLGGHLDSWHAATGATDNAIGCAVMMEAARILTALGVKPRRTIRVALWSGEEQGLLGSQAYVKEHFGTFEDPKPEFAKFAGYFNIDDGHRPGARPDGVRPAGRRDRASRGDRAVQGPRRARRDQHPQPRSGRLRLQHHSTSPGCPASASSRIRSSTATTPGTPTSTPTSASSRTT